MTRTVLTRPVAAGLMILALAGCVNIGTKPKITPNLLTLVPNATRAAPDEQTPAPDQTISMTPPIVPQMLSVNRIPVISASGRITYITDATWVEPPGALFRALVSEVVGAKTGHVVVDARALPIVAGTRLSGQLVAFGIDESSGQAVVTYDALLVRKGTVQVDARRFTAHVPVAPINGPSAGAALNDAANQVANQIAAWIEPAK